MRGPRIYQLALDIETGDIVRTSYGTGPYEVWSIYGPYHVTEWPGAIFIRDCPAISLVLIEPGTQPRLGLGCDFSYINEIRQEGERWITDNGSEVFVSKPVQRPDIPFDMFRSYPEPIVYPFDPAVDYRAGKRRVWRCLGCKLDFNGAPASDNEPVCCPKCRWLGLCEIIMRDFNR